MLNASQVRTNRAAFSEASMSRQPGQVHRLVGHHADGRALHPAEADHDIRREPGVDLEELAVVEHVGDHLVHVVGLVRRVGDERVEFRVRLVRLWFRCPVPPSAAASRGGSSRLLEGR